MDEFFGRIDVDITLLTEHIPTVDRYDLGRFRIMHQSCNLRPVFVDDHLKVDRFRQ